VGRQASTLEPPAAPVAQVPVQEWPSWPVIAHVSPLALLAHASIAGCGGVNVRAHARVVPSRAIAQTPASSSSSASTIVHASSLALPSQALTAAAGGAGELGAQPIEPSMLVRQVPATEALFSASTQLSVAALPLQASTWAVVGAHASTPEDVVAFTSAAVSDVLSVVVVPAPDAVHAPSAIIAIIELAA
jgi:hypothetical protein